MLNYIARFNQLKIHIMLNNTYIINKCVHKLSIQKWYTLNKNYKL